MSGLAELLGIIPALLALSFLAMPIARRPFAGALIYGGALLLSLIGVAVAVAFLLLRLSAAVARAADRFALGRRAFPARRALPVLSLRWSIWAPPRRAFMRWATDATSTSPNACCRSIPRLPRRHEPRRRLPTTPTRFLFGWEFMSLASWALVMSHHRETDNARAGYVYIVMASFGVLRLAARLRPARGRRRRLRTSPIMRAVSPTRGRCRPGCWFWR